MQGSDVIPARPIEKKKDAKPGRTTRASVRLISEIVDSTGGERCVL